MDLQAAAPQAEVLLDVKNAVGESPVWHVQEQALYWVDIEQRMVHRLDWATRAHAQWQLHERVACIALSAQGTVIAAMESGIFEITLQAKSLSSIHCLAPIAHPQKGMRFNDGHCDATGRFWVSTMQRDMSLAAPDGAVFFLDENGLSAPQVSGLITPNGLAFSLDGRRMYLSDSHPSVQKVWVLDCDSTLPELSHRAEFVDMRALPGRPDGAAVDAEDCYWICGNDAGLVHRFSPEGTMLASYPVPASKPSMCTFGGPDLQHLFVTSIMPTTSTQAHDGAVFVLHTGITGVPPALFSRFPVSSFQPVP